MARQSLSSFILSITLSCKTFRPITTRSRNSNQKYFFLSFFFLSFFFLSLCLIFRLVVTSGCIEEIFLSFEVFPHKITKCYIEIMMTLLALFFAFMMEKIDRKKVLKYLKVRFQWNSEIALIFLILFSKQSLKNQPKLNDPTLKLRMGKHIFF